MASCKSLLLIALCFALAAAMFEHEAGREDWTRKGLGEVHSYLFTETVDDFFYTLSANVFAKLSKVNGDIAWRRKLVGCTPVDLQFYKPCKRILHSPNCRT